MSTGEREFVRTTIKEDGKPPMPAFKLICAKCGETDTLPLGSKAGGYPTALVQQKMRHRGWEIGSRASHDLCPNCLDKKHKKPAKTEAKLEETVVTFIKAEEPPSMTREDRRVIFAKIDDVYIDENTGYSDGWTDERVATDLGVPLAWVRNIRAENFGEERSNSSIIQQLEEAKKTLDDAKKLYENTKSEFKRMTIQAEAVMAEFSKISSAIHNYQKELNTMNHDINRQETKIGDVWKSLRK